MKYVSKITAIGALAQNFLDSNHSIILVNDSLAKDLVADIAIQHTNAKLTKNIAAGDTLLWGSVAFRIIAVGKQANETLREAGHCTIVFNAAIELPGQIAVEGMLSPRLQLGTAICFE
jgi:Phosphotransferase system sorbitol-specific component IIA